MERKIGQKTTFDQAFTEPLIELLNEDVIMFAYSVKASTNHEVLEKIRHAHKRFQEMRQLRGWRPEDIEKIITYLKENSYEMLYDPADDECAEDFELERFLAVQVARGADGRIGCSL